MSYVHRQVCKLRLLQLSSQVMAILATHNHDNISFISPHMLKLSVARAVLVMGARGRGVTSHHNNLLHINTLTVTLQYVTGCLANGGSELFKICLFEFPPFVFVIDY